jgi:hypothetical protein
MLAHSSLFGAWHSSLAQVAVVVLLVLDNCAAMKVETGYFTEQTARNSALKRKKWSKNIA